MKPTVILNDLHLGVQRVAGTTPASQENLRYTLQLRLRAALDRFFDHDLIILGDLFDGFNVDASEVLACYFTLSEWLTETHNTLTLVAGNHDIGKRDDRLSSFGMLAQLLEDRFPTLVRVVDERSASFDGIHIIPHCMNQDLFELELAKALDAEPGYLLLHANVDNGFAECKDHSLNVSAEWLKKLSDRHTLLFAHEHQARTLNYGKHDVIVLGNQWPSSIADCLSHGPAQKDGRKYAHSISDSGVLQYETWCRDGNFVQMPWDQLDDQTAANFIRIVGSAKADQASDVISAIAKYRAKSSAFVISNAVQIEGVEGLDEMSQLTFENVKTFDVLSALLAELTPEEGEAVKELLKESA